MRYKMLLLIILITFVGCTQVTRERDFIKENTQIYEALLADGFDALVDTKEESVLVRFELPEGYNSEASVLGILGTVSGITKSNQIIVQVYENNKKTEEVTTTKQDVLDVVNEKTSVDDFLNNLDWKKY